MSDSTPATPAPGAVDAHSADAPGAQGADEHSAHGGHDSHADGHGSPALGPIDWRAWLAGIVGVAAGLVVVVAMLLRPAA